MARRHAVLIHPALRFSGVTERMLATARALESAEFRVTIVSTPGTRARMAEELGFQVRFAELPGDPWRAPFAALRTRKVLKRLEPDVLHATADSLAPLLSMLGPRLSVPWILELHRSPIARLVSDQRGFAFALVSSDSLVASVVNHGGIPRDHVRVLKNSPQPMVMHVEDTVAAGEIPDRAPLIGCSGLLDDAHATEWFLEAARLLVLGGSRAAFVVLGEGPNEGRLRRWIRERNLSERITIAPPTTPEAGECIAALDVHVSCKLEGGPGWLACLAMAEGVPSVFVAAGDAYELVEDRSSGILVEVGNPRRLADELELLSSNPEAARRMGQRARTRFLETAPPEQHATQVARVYEEALALPAHA